MTEFFKFLVGILLLLLPLLLRRRVLLGHVLLQPVGARPDKLALAALKRKHTTISNQSDSSISSISSREGPPRGELLFSPLEKIDLLYHPKSWKFSLKVKILSNKAYAKQLWSDLMYC